MDLNEEIRFRVTNVNFTQVHKTAKGMQATTSESTEKKDKASLKRGNLDDKRRRLSSVDLSDSDPTPSAMQILVRMLKHSTSFTITCLYDELGND